MNALCIKYTVHTVYNHTIVQPPLLVIEHTLSFIQVYLTFFTKDTIQLVKTHHVNAVLYTIPLRYQQCNL